MVPRNKGDPCEALRVPRSFSLRWLRPRRACNTASRIPISSGSPATSMICFLTSEDSSEPLKTCLYDCNGAEASVTIKAGEPCAPTITRHV